eukprot:752427-Hanusia_phi.AAC.1
MKRRRRRRRRRRIRRMIRRRRKWRIQEDEDVVVVEVTWIARALSSAERARHQGQRLQKRQEKAMGNRMRMTEMRLRGETIRARQ